MMENQQIRILFVENDEYSRDIFTDYFRKAGFFIEEAENGKDALEKIRATKPDIVISNMLMPVMDGLTMVQELKKDSDTAMIPVVFLTHLGRQDESISAKDLGVEDVIVRDTTPLSTLATRIRSLLSSREYILALDPESYDAKRFASDMGLPENYASSEGTDGRYVLRLRLIGGTTHKSFEAEIISV